MMTHFDNNIDDHYLSDDEYFTPSPSRIDFDALMNSSEFSFMEPFVFPEGTDFRHVDVVNATSHNTPPSPNTFLDPLDENRMTVGPQNDTMLPPSQQHLPAPKLYPQIMMPNGTPLMIVGVARFNGAPIMSLVPPMPHTATTTTTASPPPTTAPKQVKASSGSKKSRKSKQQSNMEVKSFRAKQLETEKSMTPEERNGLRSAFLAYLLALTQCTQTDTLITIPTPQIFDIWVEFSTSLAFLTHLEKWVRTRFEFTHGSEANNDAWGVVLGLAFTALTHYSAIPEAHSIKPKRKNLSPENLEKRRDNLNTYIGGKMRNFAGFKKVDLYSQSGVLTQDGGNLLLLESLYCIFIQHYDPNATASRHVEIIGRYVYCPHCGYHRDSWLVAKSQRGARDSVRRHLALGELKGKPNQFTHWIIR